MLPGAASPDAGFVLKAPGPKTELLPPNTPFPFAGMPAPNRLAEANEGGLWLKAGPCEALDRKGEVVAVGSWEKGEVEDWNKVDEGTKGGACDEGEGKVGAACEKGEGAR